jgi:hypothetical protein
MAMPSRHIYEVRPRKDHRGVDLISDALPFGRLWYVGPGAVSNAIGYAMHYSRSHNAVIRVYDEAGNVTETHEHTNSPPRLEVVGDSAIKTTALAKLRRADTIVVNPALSQNGLAAAPTPTGFAERPKGY